MPCFCGAVDCPSCGGLITVPDQEPDEQDERNEPDFEPGDEVAVKAWYCEMNGMQGTVLYVNPKEDLPVMVQLCNFREWPFEPGELELIAKGKR